MSNLLLLINLLTFFSLNLLAQQAVVIVPVADLISEPFEGSSAEIIHAYETLPISGNSCARAHQLLLHEIVDIVEGRDGQACVALSHRFYVGNGRHFPKSTYWMRKDQLVTFQKLHEAGIDIRKFPASISYEKNNIEQANNNVATLIRPVTLEGKIYSAGTRFKILHEYKEHYKVWLFMANRWQITSISKQDCFVYKDQPISERVKLFAALIKEWAHQDNGVIPYVWGGCSFCGETIEKNAFTTMPVVVDDGEDVCVKLDDLRSTPHTGLDCSGIIACAAQIFSLPYYYKNTDTLSRFMRPARVGELLHEGDLVWFPGHVMIISDIKHNPSC